MQARRIVKCINDDPHQERQGKKHQVWRFKRQQQDEHDVQIGRGQVVQRNVLQQKYLQKDQRDKPQKVD